MGGDRICVAGYTDAGGCIRPVLPYAHLNEAWLFSDGVPIVRPFARIELDVLRNVPEPPHTEDWLISARKPVCRGEVPNSARREFLNRSLDADVASLFGAPVRHEQGYWIEAGHGKRSLGTVRGRVRRVVYGSNATNKWQYRLTFDDARGNPYLLTVTDLAFRAYLDHQRIACGVPPARASQQLFRSLSNAEIYLRIGLSRHWAQYPDRCYLQINGVYTFPDYLGGRCFADFATDARSANSGESPTVDLSDLPF
jgi:hypothetical protein